MNITILGAGAWGTALGRLLHQSQQAVTLWEPFADHLEALRRTGRNEPLLPGIDLPRDWRLESDWDQALAGAQAVVVAVPSKVFRTVTARLAAFEGLVVSVTKGIEYESGLTMSGILAQTAPRARTAALSGPSFALEVARGIPTAVVSASHDESTARQAQELFHRPALRVYTTRDLLGVELGGALKNVIAIGAGVGDGLGYGDNTKAALVTRGIAEIRRLGVACGAQPETFGGLSGLGDLTVTCFSRLSRNRALGERLGRGEKAVEIVASLVSVAEGYPTARSAWNLARRLGVDAPIIDQVNAMLYEGKDPATAERDLLTRDLKAED